MEKIKLNNVYKIFGNNVAKVLPMVEQGATKEEILNQTGHTVGLDNVSIAIEICIGVGKTSFVDCDLLT